AIAITVHFVKSGETATMIPSRTAIQSTIRIRRALSQRPQRVVPCSIVPCGWSDSFAPIESTVPSWNREPGPAERTQFALRGPGRIAVQEEAVDGRAGAADVRPEGAELEQAVGVFRARQVVRRQGAQVAGAVSSRERLVQTRT